MGSILLWGLVFFTFTKLTTVKSESKKKHEEIDALYSACLKPKTFGTEPIPDVHLVFSILKPKGCLKCIYCNNAE
jgi:hypothetical protein